MDSTGLQKSGLVLVLGGCRSGKSDYALRLGESLPGPRVIIATAVATDPEMSERIANHRRRRSHLEWNTLEEPRNLASALQQVGSQNRVVLVDCLTVWLATLQHDALTKKERLGEDRIRTEIDAVLKAVNSVRVPVIMVSNEVGLGIHPETDAGRHFRDIAGRANQFCAAAAVRVVFMTAGIPQVLKGG